MVKQFNYVHYSNEFAIKTHSDNNQVHYSITIYNGVPYIVMDVINAHEVLWVSMYKTNSVHNLELFTYQTHHQEC